MAITMQGSWTVRVKSKEAASSQRFQISGSDNFTDGTYVGIVSTAPIFVSGAQWSINIQSQPTAGIWQDSNQRITFPVVSSSMLVTFDIQSNDTGPDKDYNDLILICSMPASASEFVVYGKAKTYSGPCFNPCYQGAYVIESVAALAQALAVPDLRRVIEKLYPERIPNLFRIPLPDPPPDFKPLFIPNGTANLANGLEFHSRKVGTNLRTTEVASEAKDKKGASIVNKMEEEMVKDLHASAHRISVDAAPVAAGVDLLSRQELLSIAKISDKYTAKFSCSTSVAPGLLLRFQEYDRTDSEKLGSVYTGTGPRENLGLAATDERGNYIFRFSRSTDDFASESFDTASGESFTDQIRPDLIVEVLGTGMVVNYETAPYYNVQNLRRIDLCIPQGRVHPSVSCGSDRVIQRIGDVIVLHSALSGQPNTLDVDGRITCRNANAPVLDCAGWRGELRLYACLGTPDVVERYSVRYKRIGIDSDWQFVSQQHVLNYIPHFGPIYPGTPVGSELHSVHVDGGSGGHVTVPTYTNHEGDSNWIENDLKLILSSSLYRPEDNPGPVDFKIEGYNTAGHLVKQDTIRLYIHNRISIVGRPQNSKGDILSITMGATTLGDCALFNLTDPRAVLTVRHRAVDPEGFLHSWGLSVTRGNNVSIPVVVASGVIPKSYSSALTPCNFRGTRDEATSDVDDYVLTGLQPEGGQNWLPDGQNFCAFAFTLRAYDRVTDGRTANPLVVFWQDLIGLSI